MQPDATEPIVHAIQSDGAAALVARLTDRERARSGPGVHVVVLVTDGGNQAYARVVDASSDGNGSQRWLSHARRGASPGGWSEQHHPRSEQHVGEWRRDAAAVLDRILIDHSKRAWAIDATAPYVVEFPPVELGA